MHHSDTLCDIGTWHKPRNSQKLCCENSPPPPTYVVSTFNLRSKFFPTSNYQNRHLQKLYTTFNTRMFQFKSNLLLLPSSIPTRKWRAKSRAARIRTHPRYRNRPPIPLPQINPQSRESPSRNPLTAIAAPSQPHHPQTCPAPNRQQHPSTHPNPSTSSAALA